MGESKANWNILHTNEPKPQKRYGHTMVYLPPHLLVYGGIIKDKSKFSSDIWMINLDIKINNENYEWKIIDTGKENIKPPPRMYHSAGICREGRAKGMIIVFGGRDEEKNMLNDMWGLRKHRNGTWDWVHLIYIVDFSSFQK